MAKTSLKYASGICTKDKTGWWEALRLSAKEKISRKNALRLSAKDKIGRKNAVRSSVKDKNGRIYENLNTGFGKTGSERQNRTVCLKCFVYNRIAILFFTQY
jgi:hypothetical protein